MACTRVGASARTRVGRASRESLATESCPEISENNNKERVCGEPISMTVAKTKVVAWMNTYTAGRWERSSLSPCTAVSG